MILVLPENYMPTATFITTYIIFAFAYIPQTPYSNSELCAFLAEMILEFVLLMSTVFILWTIKINMKNKMGNRPPALFQLPILGNLLQMAQEMRRTNKVPYQAFRQLSAKYGPILRIQFGEIAQVVLDDPDMIKEVLASEAWSDRFFNILYGMRSFDKPYGLLFSSGEEWREMRRFSLRTLRDFGFGKHKDQETVLWEELGELMTRLDAQIDRITSKGSLTLCMEQFFTVSVLNILWSMMAGERFSHDDKRLQKINQKLSRLLRDNPIGADAWHAYPNRFFRFLMVTFTKNGRNIKRDLREMHVFFREIFDERRALGYYKEDQSDFLEVFLKEIDNRKHDKSNTNYYTDEQLMVMVMDLFMAGSETTSNSLEFAILYMILHPQIQQKVQAEIDEVVGTSRMPSYAVDRVKMPYTEATLNEVQRMASVVPLDNRNCTQDTTLGGYFIPKGTASIINIFSVHYNPNVWEDPEIFRPERFLDENMNVVNTNKIIPFGGGKRLCLGESMAKASLFTYFTSFLQKYNFSTVPNAPIPIMEAKAGFTLCPHAFEAVISYR